MNDRGFAKLALSHRLLLRKVEQTLHQSEGRFGEQVNWVSSFNILKTR